MNNVNLRCGVCASLGMVGSAIWWRMSTGEARYLVILLALFVVFAFGWILFQELADPDLTIPAISLAEKAISDGAVILAGVCLFNAIAYVGDMFGAIIRYDFVAVERAQKFARLNIGVFACAVGIATVVGQYFDKKPGARWVGPAFLVIGFFAIGLVLTLRC